MGHTCQKLTLFDIVKSRHLNGSENWAELRWAGYEPLKMAKVMRAFGPFIQIMYDRWFVETKTGPAHVTGINDEGIRIEYFGMNGNMTGDYDWIHVPEIGKHALLKQPHLFDRHPKLK